MINIIDVKGGNPMRYSELFAVTDLLNDVIKGNEVKIRNDTKVKLMEARNVFGNIITDIDKDTSKSNTEVMTYQLSIEVKK